MECNEGNAIRLSRTIIKEKKDLNSIKQIYTLGTSKRSANTTQSQEKKGDNKYQSVNKLNTKSKKNH